MCILGFQEYSEFSRISFTLKHSKEPGTPCIFKIVMNNIWFMETGVRGPSFLKPYLACFAWKSKKAQLCILLLLLLPKKVTTALLKQLYRARAFIKPGYICFYVTFLLGVRKIEVDNYVKMVKKQKRLIEIVQLKKVQVR